MAVQIEQVSTEVIWPPFVPLEAESETGDSRVLGRARREEDPLYKR